MKMNRLAAWILVAACMTSAQGQEFAGLAPLSITVPEPELSKKFARLDIPEAYWVLAGTIATIEPDGSVSKVTVRDPSIVQLKQGGNFFSTLKDVRGFDPEPFKEAARAAVEGARFAGWDGRPRRSFINLAWRFGPLDEPSPLLLEIKPLHRGAGVLARTFAKGTSFYLWQGVGQRVDASLEPVTQQPRRHAATRPATTSRRGLGLPSLDFIRSLRGCEVSEDPLAGYTKEDLDTSIQFLRPLEPPYPDAERRSRARGTVQLQMRIDETGQVTAVHVLRGEPNFPGFAESAIGEACMAEFAPPMRGGTPVRTIHVMQFDFELN